MKFRKKPVTIEARQWDGSPEGATEIINWVLKGGGGANYHCTTPICGSPEEHVIVISTLEGEMQAGHGWWIIRGVQGEFYPCRADIFDDTYEPVGGGDQ